jgi:predicted esterase
VRLATAAALAIAATTPLIAQSGPATAGLGGTVSATSEVVTIKRGDHSINGTVETVAANGQHSAVLILTGGDARSTETVRRMAKAFAAKGIVALTYESATADVDDAAAAAATLRLRGDVIRTQIGVIGIGDGASVAAQLAKREAFRYTVAVGKGADPAVFGKNDAKSLVIHGSDDAFSEFAERTKQSVEKKYRGVTLWIAPNDDVNTLNAADSALLDRITAWAVERNA